MTADFLTYWGKAHPLPGTTVAWHPLAYHSLDVAAVVGEYLRVNPSLSSTLARLLGMAEDAAIKVAMFLAGSHDVGKFGPFQAKVEELFAQLQPDQPVPSQAAQHHSQAGISTLLDWVSARWYPDSLEDAELALEPLLNASCGHHGRPVDLSNSTGVGKRTTAAAHAYLDAVADVLGLDSFVDLWDGGGYRQASSLLAGVLTLCDWVGSMQRFFPYRAPTMSLKCYFVEAQDQARTALVELSLAEKRPSAKAGLSHLFPAFTASATPLQRFADSVELDRAGPSLFILEDETGAGKTEAALTLASRLLQAGRGTGVLVSLPTQATADALCGRLLPLANMFFEAEGGVPSFSLAHGSASLSLARLRSEHLEAGSICADLDSWAQDSSKTALLSDVGVCTIDQVALSILPVKHFCLRQLGIGQKVLVVDEAHACDAYMLKLLETALEAHAMRGGSAILLSATLPRKHKAALVAAFRKGARWTGAQAVPVSTDYPLATVASSGGMVETPIAARRVSRFTRIQRIGDSATEALVLRLLAAGKCVLLLRNTVGRAQADFDTFFALLPGQVQLAHAKFVGKHRSENDRNLLEQFGKRSTSATRKGQLVIATQVAEQSLDVDFDELITDLAPIDALLQRIGRWRRHVRDADGKMAMAGDDARGEGLVYVVAPETHGNVDFLAELPANTMFVYPLPVVLFRTAQLVEERGGLQIPAGVREAVEFAYDEEAEAPAFLAFAEERSEGKIEAAKRAAKNVRLNLTVGYSQLIADVAPEQAVTRLGEKSVRVVLCDQGGAPLFGSMELSRLSLRASLLALEVDDTGHAKLRMGAAGSGEWEMLAVDHASKERLVRYSRTRGFSVGPPQRRR
ncbi:MULTISPECIES: CRISPR-associated helicase/endonuclease Cas3 [unclassified Variovorax]|uniref:CRISPR-associated helicase/endonuclease Cas3 n=1 Tax=unclassified Variovorax TaxID=663243 RepID=UPI00076DADAD|nr:MULTISPECIES: CRISPR-associated helicase/endonuclease Cas3 [unclassified Variovorax]KWT98067.1 CRISPR-associated helicase Cas3, protein [Variovorax sp. WDL1]PNG50458.1 CRISPR-associated endonuclease/helicase Cas3 [Variovorax sp. B2]PNG51331.1 CRISPR-associated endonuclease/helicase Cas3 [Variovorax sp. B4]VTU43235.1 CRISPR-associated endonuclease/helicase Cas3 [Variovorax sp. PBL-H6]VTU43361.1 CRISPR-associated endonuclease/helicase Cas3 [Variovorax sp. SRS16]